MPPTSAAMELKVLISVLQSGQALQTMLNQIKQVSTALTNLQSQSALGGGVAAGNTSAATAAAKGLAAAAQAAAGGVTAAGRAANNAAPELLTLEEALNKVWTATKFVAGGFLALQSVRFLRDMGEVAARTETMGTVLHIVARNAGYTTEEIDKVDKSVQRLGITATSSRQALTQMLQAGLDIKFADRLARASQDLAVLSGLDSSNTLQRMVTNIQQLDTLGLRWMGIVVNRTEAEREYAKAIGKTADALSMRQRTEALTEGVLKKAAELSGTYEAAMGDVGKQMTSLTRFILEAKDAWGNALLPTMRVVVSEFTIFLQHMTTLGREFSANRSLAEGFADVIRVIARTIRLAAEALAEHYDLIMMVVKAWLAWKAINLLVPLVAFTRWVIEMGPILVAYVYATDAAAAANVRFAASLALIQNISIVYLLIVMANSIVLLAEAMERANKAWEEGKFWQFISARDTRSMGERFEEALSPITGAAARKSMESFRRQLALPGEQIPTSQRWEPTAPTLEAKYADMSDQIAQRRKALNLATDAVRAAEERYAEAMRSGSQEELEASKKALEAAKAVRLAENQLFDEILARKEVDPKRREAELMFQKRQKEYNELKQLGKDVALAEEDLFKKVSITPEGKVTSAASDKRLNEVRTQMDIYDRRVKAVGDMMATSRRSGELMSQNMQEFFNNNANILVRIRENLKQFVGPAAELPGDLEGFLDVLQRFRKETREPADITLIQNLEAMARLQIRAKTQGQFALVRQERARITRDEQAALTQNAEFQLELQQQTNDRAQALDEQRYEMGLLSLDEYYAARLERAQKQNALEIRAQEARIIAIEAERPTTLPQDLPALENKLQQAREKLETIRRSGENQAQQLSLEYGRARIDLERQVLDLRLKTAAAYGSESAALQQVTEEYKRLQEQLKAVAAAEGREIDPETRRALEVAQTQATLRVQEEFRQKRFEADLEHEEATRRQLDLEKQRRDLARQEISARQAAGQISEFDAMQQRNALLERDIAGARERIASLQRTLARQQDELVTAPARRRKELQEAGLNTPEEIEQQVQAMVNSIQAGVLQTRGEIETLTGSITQMMLTMETYGRQVAKTFQEGFADALTQTIMDYRKAGEAWVNLSRSITNEIVSIFVKAFTQRLFGRFAFSFVDRFMNSIFGSRQQPLPGASSGMFFLPTGFGLGMSGGGPVQGPGTGTSDSVPALLSAGEHVMPAHRAAQWMPVLEGIRTGAIRPFATGGLVQSFAPPPIIPQRYASGGVVVSDGGASAVQTGGGVGNMMVTMHPDTLNMTMREWLEHEVVRQQGRR